MLTVYVASTLNYNLIDKYINKSCLKKIPGETFSYNATVGQRTIAAGYKDAKIYQNGQVVDGLGGGICQISSTLYNSVVLANLDIVARKNHGFVTSYLPNLTLLFNKPIFLYLLKVYFSFYCSRKIYNIMNIKLYKKV